MSTRNAVGWTILATILFAGRADAGLFTHGEKPTPPPGKPRHIEHTHERAGHPREVSHWAAPTITDRYDGGYVGGGLVLFGHERRPEEGTWGWDYTGRHGLRRVFQGWSHGRHSQGGTGFYRIDGPRVPDPIAGVSRLIRK